MNIGKKLTTLKVHVTQKHIDNGNPKSCDACATALALEEAIGKTVWVGTIDFMVDDDDDTEFSLPKNARQFIQRFDGYASGAIEPFMFDVRVPLALLASAVREGEVQP